MPRSRTGTVREISGRWHAKITLADGKRTPWKPLAPHIRDEAAAKAEASRLAARLYAASVAQGRGKGEAGTVDGFAGDLFDRRHKEGKRSVGRERRLWKARVSGHLGSL